MQAGASLSVNRWPPVDPDLLSAGADWGVMVVEQNRTTTPVCLGVRVCRSSVRWFHRTHVRSLCRRSPCGAGVEFGPLSIYQTPCEARVEGGGPCRSSLDALLCCGRSCATCFIMAALPLRDWHTARRQSGTDFSLGRARTLAAAPCLALSAISMTSWRVRIVNPGFALAKDSRPGIEEPSPPVGLSTRLRDVGPRGVVPGTRARRPEATLIGKLRYFRRLSPLLASLRP